MAKQTLEFTSMLNADAVAEYLEELARGLRGGRVSLESGNELIVLSVGGGLAFDLEAKASDKSGTCIELKLDWRKKKQGREAGSSLRVRAHQQSEPSDQAFEAPDMKSDGEE